MTPPETTQPETAPDGRPMVGPFDRAGWRAWLIANHRTSSGVHLVSWRSGTGRTSIPYDEAVEEALCVGWIDSVTGRLDDERALQWFGPRRPRSGWASSNKERVERLIAAGRMLPAGLEAIETAKQNGSWSLFDDVERLVVPDDLARALEGLPGARATWDAFSPSSRKQLLGWVVQARRAETRARRIAEIADHAARGLKPPAFRPRD
jgi:uncharacterized protein YdeI (YjbR/CyaY-like superfamily)